MKINILGFSEATLSMILDIIESNGEKFDIDVINNLSLEPRYEFINPFFNIRIIQQIQEGWELKYLIGLSNPNYKSKILKTFNIEENKFINVIHKSSSVSTTSNFGYGCIINPMVTIAAHTKIKNHVMINRNSSVGHHTLIEDFVTINPGVNVAGHVEIGEGTTIGMGTNISNGIKIGKNSVIGAGSFVNKDIPDNVIAWGSPCKIISVNKK